MARGPRVVRTMSATALPAMILLSCALRPLSLLAFVCRTCTGACCMMILSVLVCGGADIYVDVAMGMGMTTSSCLPFSNVRLFQNVMGRVSQLDDDLMISLTVHSASQYQQYKPTNDNYRMYRTRMRAVSEGQRTTRAFSPENRFK